MTRPVFLSLFAVVAATSACGAAADDDVGITVHAPGQALAILEGDLWTSVSTDAGGNAVIHPTGPFALAGLCGERHGLRERVYVIMADPTDANSFVLPCPQERGLRATLDIEVVGGGIATVYFGATEADEADVVDRGIVSVPIGRRDVIALSQSTSPRRFLVERGLELAASDRRTLVLDFAKQVSMAERAVEGEAFGVSFQLRTRNHTIVQLPARYDDGPAQVFAPENLIDGDRQVVTSSNHLDAPTTRSTMARIRADHGGPVVSVPPTTTERLGDCSITLGGTHVMATWVSPESWPSRRVYTYGTAIWDITVHPGWSSTAAGPEGSLATPDLGGHPRWEERYAIRPSMYRSGAIELYRPIDAHREVGVSASVAPQ